MALTANRKVSEFVGDNYRFEDYPVLAAKHIYQGGFVGLTPSGHAKPFEPGDVFVGVSYEERDNTNGASAALYVRTITQNFDFEHTLTSVAITDVGKAVYATADDTLSLTGHPDAFVGKIISRTAANTCRVRARNFGEAPPNDGTCQLVEIDFAKETFAALDEATATSVVCGGRLKTACIGAGLTAGTTGLIPNEATGQMRMLIDNDNEAENLTLETPQVFNITKGVTFEATLTLQAAGSAATDDFDFGLMGLSGGITTTERADMDAGTAGLLSAKFHVDTNGLDLLFSSDDNAAPVAATDTTVNLVLTTAVNVKIVCRVGGSCEVWVNNVRYLPTTAFSVGAAGLLAGIINIEKPAAGGAGVPEVRVRKLRVAGAIA